MSLHQVIYTSCRRGRETNRTTGGQQMFSCDKDYVVNDNKGIMDLREEYSIPKTSEAMTDELALTMPDSFSLTKMANGNTAIYLITYLGRDYNGARFGNKLSHIITGDEEDIKIYPCELYGGSSFRKRLEPEEVNNPNIPDYLPLPVLSKGNIINLNSISEFLSEDNRLDILVNMFFKLIESDKQIIIKDKHENIIFWIAALEYLFPIKSSRKISFSTYVNDFTKTKSQYHSDFSICGVLEDTSFSTNLTGSYYLFDIINNSYPQTNFKDDYIDFFVNAFKTNNISEIDSFTTYINDNFEFSNYNKEILDAYRVYNLLNNFKPIESEEEIVSIIRFININATDNTKQKIIDFFINNTALLYNSIDVVFKRIINFILSNKALISNKEDVDLITPCLKRLLNKFLADDKSDFNSFKEYVETIKVDYTKLLSNSYIDKVFSVISENTIEWKLGFIKDLFVKTYNNDDFVNNYFNYFKTVLNNNPQKCEEVIDDYIKYYKNNNEKMVASILLFERKLAEENIPTITLWNQFNKYISNRNLIRDIYKYLFKNKLYGRMYDLFIIEINKTKSNSNYRTIFNYQYEKYIKSSEEYENAYFKNIISIYFSKINNNSSNDYLIDLYKLLLSTNTANEVLINLGQIITDYISIDSITPITKFFVDKVSLDSLNEQQINKLFLVKTIKIIDNITDIETLNYSLLSAFEKYKCPYNSFNKIGLNEEKTEIKQYISKVAPILCSKCNNQEDIKMMFDIFTFNEDNKRLFVNICFQEFFKLNKQKKKIFIEFLKFVIESSDKYIRQIVVGKIQDDIKQYDDFEDDLKHYYKKKKEDVHLERVKNMFYKPSLWDKIRR